MKKKNDARMMMKSAERSRCFGRVTGSRIRIDDDATNNKEMTKPLGWKYKYIYVDGENYCANKEK
jgi:hypothetical protein